MKLQETAKAARQRQRATQKTEHARTHARTQSEHTCAAAGTTAAGGAGSTAAGGAAGMSCTVHCSWC